jgi:hypothetical protein
MNKLMGLIGWVVVGFLGASLVNEILYQMIPLPKEGVSLFKAVFPAIGAASFFGFCVYKGFKNFSKKESEE